MIRPVLIVYVSLSLSGAVQFSAVHSSGADCVGLKELQFMAGRVCANYLAMQLDTSRLQG